MLEGTNLTPSYDPRPLHSAQQRRVESRALRAQQPHQPAQGGSRSHSVRARANSKTVRNCHDIFHWPAVVARWAVPC